jgi:hypothetical protein
MYWWQQRWYGCFNVKIAKMSPRVLEQAHVVLEEKRNNKLFEKNSPSEVTIRRFQVSRTEHQGLCFVRSTNL